MGTARVSYPSDDEVLTATSYSISVTSEEAVIRGLSKMDKAIYSRNELRLRFDVLGVADKEPRAMQKSEKLVEEIREITLQYLAEVGSARKPWPKSIITRVIELHEMGLSWKAISDRTEIPYCSILNWREQFCEKKFHALTVKPLPSQTVTVPKLESEANVGTVTVTTPEGYRIEVGSIGFAIELLKKLRWLRTMHVMQFPEKWRRMFTEY